MAQEDYPAIQELWQVLRSGRSVIDGQAFINEEALFVATSRLKKQMLSHLTALGRADSKSDPETRQLLAPIDTLEGIIEAGKFHFGGVVMIKKQVFRDKMAEVEAALEQLGAPSRGGAGQQHAIPDSPWS